MIIELAQAERITGPKAPPYTSLGRSPRLHLKRPLRTLLSPNREFRVGGLLQAIIANHELAS
jgi:hypothetical protein